jgi:hypothetical protein
VRCKQTAPQVPQRRDAPGGAPEPHQHGGA